MDDWIQATYRIPRHMKGFGLSSDVLMWLDAPRRLDPDSARPVEAKLKELGIVPKDAWLDGIFHVVQQDMCVLRFMHQSFPEIHEADVIDCPAVSVDDLLEARKKAKVHRVF